jgi:hypothetical protein
MISAEGVSFDPHYLKGVTTPSRPALFKRSELDQGILFKRSELLEKRTDGFLTLGETICIPDANNLTARICVIGH